MTLSVPAIVEVGQEVVLVEAGSKVPVAIMRVEECWAADFEREVQACLDKGRCKGSHVPKM